MCRSPAGRTCTCRSRSGSPPRASRRRGRDNARPACASKMRLLDPQSLTRHIDRLYRAAWALCGSREDAEDLVQETFARVLSRPRMLRGDDELYYLMRVLRNTFLTTRRTAARRPLTVATLEDVVTADGRPTGRPEQALEISELYATIAELPDDFRLALVAVDVRAPESLRASVQEMVAGRTRTRDARGRGFATRARRPLVLAGAVATAAAVLAATLLVGGTSTPAGPTLSEAAALTLAPATH